MKRIVIFSVLLCFSVITKGHYIYPEIYKNCYVDQFDFEKDKIIVPQEAERIIEVVTMGWDEKVLKKAKGFLGLQMLIDKKGKSCLMSVRNDTNMKPKKMNLEGNINDHLEWQRLANKISVIILLEFDGENISVKRLGTLDMVNLVEIDN